MTAATVHNKYVLMARSSPMASLHPARTIPLDKTSVCPLILESPKKYKIGEKKAKIATTELLIDMVARFILYVAPMSSRVASKKKRKAKLVMITCKVDFLFMGSLPEYRSGEVVMAPRSSWAT
jgi:hypothetical protein